MQGPTNRCWCVQASVPLQLSSAFDAAQESNAAEGSCYESAGDSFSRSQEASRQVCPLLQAAPGATMLNRVDQLQSS